MNKKNVWSKLKKGTLKSCKGAISIMLCLLATPFLTLACGLVELSRYQSYEETMHQIVNNASLSTLADYDKYLQDRFGLLAVSQEKSIADTFSDNINSNINLLGGLVTPDANISAKGVNSLSDINILKSQILDYSEATIPVEILAENLNIKDIFNKITGGQVKDKLDNLSKGIDKGQSVIDAIKAIVDAVDPVIKFIKEYKQKKEAFDKEYDELIKAIGDFNLKLKQDGVIWDANHGTDEILKNDTYLGMLMDIYKKAKKCSDDNGSISDLLLEIGSSGVSTKVKTACDKLKAAKVKIAGLDSQTTDLYSAVVSVFETAVDNAMMTFNTSQFTALSNALKNLKDIIKNTYVPELNNYESIHSFSDLDDNSKNVLQGLCSRCMTIYNDDPFKDGVIPDNQTLYDAVSNKYFLSEVSDNGFINFITGLNNITSVGDTFQESVDKARKKFEQQTADAATGALSQIMNAISQLFSLQLLYNGDFDAVLDEDTYKSLTSNKTGRQSPYQTLLDAINKFNKAVANIQDAVENFKIFDIFYECKNIFDAAKEMIQFLIKEVEAIGNRLVELGKMFYDFGNLGENMYNSLLINGYATFNFPNRTSDARTFNMKADLENGKFYYTKKLNGSATTGYLFSNIKVSPTILAQRIDEDTDEYNSTKPKDYESILYGSDKTFKGAELEYILSGTSNEIFNQEVVFMQLYLFRFIIDAFPVAMNSEVQAMSSVAGVFQPLLVIAFMLAEPLVDNILLVNGTTAPMIKKSCYLTPTGIMPLIEKLIKVCVKNSQVSKILKDNLGGLASSNNDDSSNGGSGSNDESGNNGSGNNGSGNNGSGNNGSGNNGSGNGSGGKVNLSKEDPDLNENKEEDESFKEGILQLDYTKHLFLLLVLSLDLTEDKKVSRISDLIQLESESYYADSNKNKTFTFKSSNAYTTIETDATVTFNSFISVFNINDQSIFTKNYIQDKSY